MLLNLFLLDVIADDIDLLAGSNLELAELTSRLDKAALGL